jgi:hypothetical protein
MSSSSAGGCAFFLGRPLLLLGGASVSTSAAFASVAPVLRSRDFDLAARFFGVPARLSLGVAPTSDFLGRPRPRLTGEDASGSFKGTVVVCVLVVTRLTLGDCAFSSSLPGSAWTVTLIRHGLALPILGVFITMALDGDENSNSETPPRRFCLLGDVEPSGFRGVALRADFALFSSKDMANGSGLESLLRTSKSLVTGERPRYAMAAADGRNSVYSLVAMVLQRPTVGMRARCGPCACRHPSNNLICTPAGASHHDKDRRSSLCMSMEWRWVFTGEYFRTREMLQD